VEIKICETGDGKSGGKIYVSIEYNRRRTMSKVRISANGNNESMLKEFYVIHDTLVSVLDNGFDCLMK
jgi:hypothetical protein